MTSTPTWLTTLSTTPSSAALELLLVDVVLVHADADGLGVDLDQLGQRVLHAAGDGDGAAHADIQVGQLGAGQRAGRVDAGAGLVDDQVVRAVGQAADERGHQLFGLARGGAVADGDQRDVVLLHQAAQCVQRLGLAVLRRVRVDGDRVEQLAGGVDHGHLAAGAEAGVDAQHGVAGERRLAEQAAQVGGKDRDGVAFGLLAQRAAHVALDGRQEQALGAVLGGEHQLLGPG